MRSPVLFLALSLAAIFAVVFSFGSVLLNGPRGNLTDDVIVTFGVLAVIPFLLTTLIAAIALVRRARAPLPHTNGKFGCFLAVLFACGVVWAFYLFVGMAVSSG
jgi:hypothetical protein